jgi:hypothetical protein
MAQFKKNNFTLNSFADEVFKDLEKEQKQQLKKASAVVKKQTRTNIRGLGLVDDGDLLKGVKDDVRTNAVFVGMAAPAFHALIVEYGTVERFTKGKGDERKGIRSTGVMPATPYFLPAFNSTLSTIQKIMSEEW